MGIVICFIGIDGSGKSTLIKEVAKAYKKSFDVKADCLYFGWQPFLPFTKLLSLLFKRKGYKITERMNKKKINFSLLQEMMLFYYYIEYLARYISKILPKQVAIVDRYFYDAYAHYDYASRSLIFKNLINLFPKPDYLFFLDVDVKIAKERKPEININLLKLHRKRYLELSKLMKIKTINTRENIKDCVEFVINNTKARIASD